MGAFDQITGQNRAISILKRAILADRVSHAWLFCGPSASQMQALALAFAATLQCTQRPLETADACMQCRSCRQAADGNHPDILIWKHEKAKTFSIDEVRSLVADISIRPYESSRKIYIVPDAHLMRTEAQNALLKTLEEPPEYVVLILLSPSADAMLETVRSRCQMVELSAGETEYPPLLLKDAEDILIHIHSWNLPQIKTAVKTLAQYKDQADLVLALFTSWYRDILYFKASANPEGVLVKEHLSKIQNSAQIMSFEDIQHVLNGIRDAGLRLKANVNYDVTMELLLLTMAH